MALGKWHWKIFHRRNGTGKTGTGKKMYRRNDAGKYGTVKKGTD